MDNYKLLEPVRAIREFIDDLSTWYLRRSRDRIKEEVGNSKDQYGARTTLYYVFKTLVKVMAPFAPFSADDIWQKLKNNKDLESVHLVDWPESLTIDEKVINEMQEVREIVTLGLQARQKAGIPVRQPLGQLIITNYKLPKEYEEIVKDELNVKEIKIVEGEEKKVEIDTHITLELRGEGQYRELVRAIQDIRKKIGLNPNDLVVVQISTSVEGQEIINKFKSELSKTVGANEIQIKENDGSQVKIDDLVFVVSVIR